MLLRKLLTFATRCYTAELLVVFLTGFSPKSGGVFPAFLQTFRCRAAKLGRSGVPARPSKQNRPWPFRWENARG
jgi:hypothetical protein